MRLRPVHSWKHGDRAVTRYDVKDYVGAVARVYIQHVLPAWVPVRRIDLRLNVHKDWTLSELEELVILGKDAVCQTKSSVKQFTNSRH
jgi:hypothetical protein